MCCDITTPKNEINNQYHNEESNLVEKLTKKQKLPVFQTDVNNKRYIIRLKCCLCLVYLRDSLQT